jgi:hypothetical protein
MGRIHRCDVPGGRDRVLTCDLFRVSKTPGTAVPGAVLPGHLRPSTRKGNAHLTSRETLFFQPPADPQSPLHHPLAAAMQSTVRTRRKHPAAVQRLRRCRTFGRPSLCDVDFGHGFCTPLGPRRRGRGGFTETVAILRQAFQAGRFPAQRWVTTVTAGRGRRRRSGRRPGPARPPGPWPWAGALGRSAGPGRSCAPGRSAVRRPRTPRRR